MDKKNRFSLKKVCFWVTLINVVFLGLLLTMIYYVKMPYQTYRSNDFNLPRFVFRWAVSLAFQCVFDYFVLNQYYKLMVRKAPWPSWVKLTLVFFLVSFIYYFFNDITIRKEELKVPLDISLKIFSYSLSNIF